MKHIINYNQYKLLLESLASARKKYAYLKDVYKANNYDPNREIDMLASQDPSPTKKYVEKMCDWYFIDLKGNMVMINDIGDMVKIYDMLCNRNLIKEKDITQFKTWKSFRFFVEQNKNNTSKTSIDKQMKSGGKVLYEDDNFIIMHMTTHDSCILYGTDTKWCVTEKGPRWWNKYKTYSTIYFIINKNYPQRHPRAKVAAQVMKDEIIFNTSDNKQFSKMNELPKELYKYLKYIPFDWDSVPTIEEKFSLLFEGFDPKHMTINADQTVDYSDGVYIQECKLEKIPIKFNKVDGNFYCQDNSLVTLEGAPNIVTGRFLCQYNNLKNLKGGPSYAGEYLATDNPIDSIEWLPKEVENDFELEVKINASQDEIEHEISNRCKVGGNLYVSNINKLFK